MNRGHGYGGRLLYTDFNDAALNAFEIDIAGTVAKLTAFLHGVAEDADREIYFLFGNGQIMKLVPESATWVLAAILLLAGAGRFRRLDVVK